MNSMEMHFISCSFILKIRSNTRYMMSVLQILQKLLLSLFRDIYILNSYSVSSIFQEFIPIYIAVFLRPTVWKLE